MLGITCPILMPAQTSLGAVGVGKLSAATVTVAVSSAGTLSNIEVLTQGAPNLDFTNASGGTCSIGTAYAANSSCTVVVNFAPNYAGTRYGAVVLQDGSGNILGFGYLQGTGLGPQFGFLPFSSNGYLSTQEPCSASGVATDAAGNLYITCPNSSAAYKETPSSGGWIETQIAFGLQKPDGLYSPQGIAVDGAGSVYISDSTQNRVVKETPTATGYTQTTVVTGLQQPMGLAVDGAGNLYIVNTFVATVLKETLTGSGYTQSQLASGLDDPIGVAVDGNGNVFVTSAFGSNGIYMFAYSAGSYTQQMLGSGFNSPGGVGVDGVGNVYIQDMTDIYKETLVNGSYTQIALDTPEVLPNNPGLGFAVDSPGNLWMVTRSFVQEFGEAEQSPLNFEYTTLGIPSPYPYTMGVMNIGNEPLNFSQISFPTDFPEGSTPPNPPDFPPNDPPTGTCTLNTTLAIGQYCYLTIEFLPISSLDGQYSATLSEDVTLAGNVASIGETQVVIPVSGSYGQPVSSISIAPSAAPSVAGTPFTITATVPGTDVAHTGTVTFYLAPSTALGTFQLDGTGHATYTATLPVGVYEYSATYSGDSNYKAARSTQILVNIVAPPATAPFGNTSIGAQNVGSSSNSILLTISFNTAETLGSIAVLTLGAPNLDFTDTGGGTCTVGTAYAASATCTVNVVFNPRLPGPRYGAVVLTDGNGNVIGTGYLQGTGQGPQIAFSPGTLTTLSSPSSITKGVAVDASGNVYLALDAIYKLTLSNGQYTQSVIASGFTDPYGVAVDGSGNVYVADLGNYVTVPAVYKETPSASGYTQTSIGYGLQVPESIAVDGAGNVYIADYGATSNSGLVYKETPSNGTYIQSTVGTGWESPAGVAVDGSGNLYVTDDGSYTIVKETLSNGAYIGSTIGSTLHTPGGIAVDISGNVYVTDNDGLGDGSVIKMSLSNGSYAQSTLVSSLKYPGAIAVDGSGNVYISNWGSATAVYKLDVFDPPALSFATTNRGATSSDSPQVITVSNAGNSTLNFSAVGYPADFPEGSPGTGSCTASTALASGTSCTLTIDFTPIAGGAENSTNTLQESVTLTTNQLNAPGSQQSIAVTGEETITVPPSFALSGTSVSVAPGATTGNTSAVTLTPANSFTGSVTLTATLTSSPAGAQYPPTLSFGSTSPVSITSTTAGTATLTITTTAASSSALAYPKRPGVPWYAASGAALACLLFFGMPTRQRSWRNMLGMLVLLIALTAGVMACGGGGTGGGSGGGGGIAGTTAGTYTITVTGTSGSTTETATVSLTVQ